MMNAEPRFKLGQRVYHVMGGEDARGIVTGITAREKWFTYLVTFPDREEKPCYEMELSEEPVRDFAD